jgi:hypothetical protein
VKTLLLSLIAFTLAACATTKPLHCGEIRTDKATGEVEACICDDPAATAKDVCPPGQPTT